MNILWKMVYNYLILNPNMGFPGVSVFKNSPANAGETRHSGLIPGSGRSPRVGNGNPLQNSWLENPMYRGSWRATVRGVETSLTRLK